MLLGNVSQTEARRMDTEAISSPTTFAKSTIYLKVWLALNHMHAGEKAPFELSQRSP